MSKLSFCALLVISACAAPSTSAPPPVAPSDGSSPGGGPLSAEQVVGYWSGDWGQLVFRQEGDKLLATYNHDEGTIAGILVGDKLVGWWCEAPSRTPDSDAGEVEMKFITRPDGTRAIDGRWRYGTAGEWQENWDINFANEAAPEALVARFSNVEAFCAKPQ